MSVIFLNGCTSAGKSSIAKALQMDLPAPYLLTGIDDAFAMLPPGMHNHEAGVFFDRDPDGLIRLNYGEFGLAALKAHHRAAAAIAKGGVDLILDEVVLNPDLLDSWRAELRDVDVFWVGVHCDLEELERRERTRGDRVPGQARGQFESVHRHMTYDFEIDSSTSTPTECAAKIIEALF